MLGPPCPPAHDPGGLAIGRAGKSSAQRGALPGPSPSTKFFMRRTRNLTRDFLKTESLSETLRLAPNHPRRTIPPCHAKLFFCRDGAQSDGVWGAVAVGVAPLLDRDTLRLPSGCDTASRNDCVGVTVSFPQNRDLATKHTVRRAGATVPPRPPLNTQVSPPPRIPKKPHPLAPMAGPSRPRRPATTAWNAD